MSMELTRAKFQSKYRVEEYIRTNYNLYSILGVHPSISQEAIKRKISTYILPTHPDHGGTDANVRKSILLRKVLRDLRTRDFYNACEQNVLRILQVWIVLRMDFGSGFPSVTELLPFLDPLLLRSGVPDMEKMLEWFYPKKQTLFGTLDDETGPESLRFFWEYGSHDQRRFIEKLCDDSNNSYNEKIRTERLRRQQEKAARAKDRKVERDRAQEESERDAAVAAEYERRQEERRKTWARISREREQAEEERERAEEEPLNPPPSPPMELSPLSSPIPSPAPSSPFVFRTHASPLPTPSPPSSYREPSPKRGRGKGKGRGSRGNGGSSTPLTRERYEEVQRENNEKAKVKREERAAKRAGGSAPKRVYKRKPRKISDHEDDGRECSPSRPSTSSSTPCGPNVPQSKPSPQPPPKSPIPKEDSNEPQPQCSTSPPSSTSTYSKSRMNEEEASVSPPQAPPPRSTTPDNASNEFEENRENTQPSPMPHQSQNDFDPSSPQASGSQQDTQDHRPFTPPLPPSPASNIDIIMSMDRDIKETFTKMKPLVLDNIGEEKEKLDALLVAKSELEEELLESLREKEAVLKQLLEQCQDVYLLLGVTKQDRKKIMAVKDKEIAAVKLRIENMMALANKWGFNINN